MDMSKLEHVFLLMLENRSFDHMLGLSGITGTDAVTGAPTTIDGLAGTESNAYNGTTYAVSQPAPQQMPVDPGHEFTDTLIQLAGPGATYPAGGPYPPTTSTKCRRRPRRSPESRRCDRRRRPAPMEHGRAVADAALRRQCLDGPPRLARALLHLHRRVDGRSRASRAGDRTRSRDSA